MKVNNPNSINQIKNTLRKDESIGDEFSELNNEIDKLISGQKEAEEGYEFESAQQNQRNIQARAQNQKKNQHTPVTPNLPPSSLTKAIGMNLGYIQNGKGQAKQSKKKNKGYFGGNLGNDLVIGPNMTPTLGANVNITPNLSNNIMNVNPIFATPTLHQQHPLINQALYDQQLRPALSPVFMFNNNQPNQNINLTPGITYNHQFAASPYCYTPNPNINFQVGGVFNGAHSPIPETIYSQSPYSFNNFKLSPLINNRNGQNVLQNPPQASSVFNGGMFNTVTNEETILDNMLNKKNKIKKVKKNLNEKVQNSPLTKTSSTSVQSAKSMSHFFDGQNSGSPNIIGNQGEEERNKINIETIITQKDKRTTLMIKNIPNKYTITTFLDEINEEFKSKYDIFYLPIDYGNKCNLGFAFINFVDPLHIIYFYNLYRGKKWKRFNSEKICELVYAKIQGKKELISHFEKGKVLSFDSEEKRPLILPTPNPLPKIKLPLSVLELFKKHFPYAVYNVENNTKQHEENNEEFSVNNSGVFIVDNLYSFN